MTKSHSFLGAGEFVGLRDGKGAPQSCVSACDARIVRNPAGLTGIGWRLARGEARFSRTSGAFPPHVEGGPHSNGGCESKIATGATLKMLYR